MYSRIQCLHVGLPLGLLHALKGLQQIDIEGDLFADPSAIGSVVRDVVASVGVDENRARTAVGHKPRKQRAELLGVEDVDLEHGHGVRAEGTLEEAVCAAFRELSPHGLVQLVRVGDVARVCCFLPILAQNAHERDLKMRVTAK